MCGRYYIDDDTIREMEKLVRQIDKKLLEEKSRDVFPSQSAPVVTGREGELCGEELISYLSEPDKSAFAPATRITASV